MSESERAVFSIKYAQMIETNASPRQPNAHTETQRNNNTAKW